MIRDAESDDEKERFVYSDKYYVKELMDLLCIIHRDGGQYINKHGVEKAIKDARKIVVKAIVK